MNRIQGLSTLCALSLFTFACGNADKKDERNAQGAVQPNGPAAKTGTAKPRNTANGDALPSLVGLWKRPCEPNSVASSQLVNSYEKEKAHMGVSVFSDQECEARIIEMTLKGTYAVGTAGKVPGTREFDFNVESFWLTPHTDGVVAQWNTAPGQCGSTDWKLGEEKDVTGKVCFYDNNGNPRAPVVKNTVVYGLLRHEGDKHFLGVTPPGNANDGQTKERRQDTLESVGFERK